MTAAKKLLSEELIEERREEQRRENEQDAARDTECRFTPAWQPGTDSNLQRAGKQPSAARTPERKRLFWKQIEQARKDVEAWPDYLRRAFGVKPLDR